MGEASTLAPFASNNFVRCVSPLAAERSVAHHWLEVDIGTMIEEEFHDGEIIQADGEIERIAVVDVGAMFQQNLDGFDVASSNGHEERRWESLGRFVYFCAPFEE